MLNRIRILVATMLLLATAAAIFPSTTSAQVVDCYAGYPGSGRFGCCQDVAPDEFTLCHTRTGDCTNTVFDFRGIYNSEDLCYPSCIPPGCDDNLPERPRTVLDSILDEILNPPFTAATATTSDQDPGLPHVCIPRYDNPPKGDAVCVWVSGEMMPTQTTCIHGTVNPPVGYYHHQSCVPAGCPSWLCSGGDPSIPDRPRTPFDSIINELVNEPILP